MRTAFATMALAVLIISYAHADDGEMFPQVDSPAEQPSQGPAKGLLDPCDQSLQDIKNFRSKTPTSDEKSCSNQIEKSWKTCYVADDPTDPTKPYSNDDDTAALYQNTPGASGTGIASGDSKLIGAYTTGKTRSLDRSQVCLDEKKKVDNVCGAVANDLNDKLRGNSQATNSVDDTLNETPGTSPQRQDFINQQDQLHQQSQQLQSQRNQFSELYSAGAKALANRAKCHANQASLYDQQIDKTQAHLAGVSSVDSSNSADQSAGGNSDVDSAKKTAASKTAAATVNQTVGTEVGGSTESLGKAAFTMATGDFGGAIADTAGDGAGALAENSLIRGGTAGAIAGPAGAVVGAAVSVATSPTPTSACDTIYIDPVNAYKNGCSVSTGMAINALRSP